MAQLVRKLVGWMVQLVRFTTCDWNGAPAQVGSLGANRLNVTVPVGGLLLLSGVSPAMVAVSDRLTAGTPLCRACRPRRRGADLGKETSAEPSPPPGWLFTASVALAAPSTQPGCRCERVGILGRQRIDIQGEADGAHAADRQREAGRDADLAAGGVDHGKVKVVTAPQPTPVPDGAQREDAGQPKIGGHARAIRARDEQPACRNERDAGDVVAVGCWALYLPSAICTLAGTAVWPTLTVAGKVGVTPMPTPACAGNVLNHNTVIAVTSLAMDTAKLFRRDCLMPVDLLIFIPPRRRYPTRNAPTSTIAVLYLL